MNIGDIIPAVDALRDPEQLEGMIRFVQEGRLFTPEVLALHSERRGGPIAITRFEDGKFFLRDGSHRTCAIWAGGRKILAESEYVIENSTYAMYQEVNFEKTWVTPFDPRTHVRLADFWAYKMEVMMKLQKGETEALLFVRRNVERYCVLRTSHTISGLLAATSTEGDKV